MRLHIGASRTQLATPNVGALRTDDWIHLGEPEPMEESSATSLGIPMDASPQPVNWLCFYYKLGNVLPFPDEYFSFGFSEHFFEHLFLDEACELFKECNRVLQPGACLRTVVPDSDLRTYMEPEPAGFSTGDNRWFHPDKHKSRWSIHSLPYVLEQTGFQTRGVVYCDKCGRHSVQMPDVSHEFYQNCLDPEIVMRTDYVCKFANSLIVDAIKPLRK